MFGNHRKQLTRIELAQERIMADIDTLNGLVTKIQSDTTTTATNVSEVLDLLKTAQANGTPVDLTAAIAGLTAADASLTTIDTSLSAVVPAATGTAPPATAS
jgi:hypothetical protein